ncbi:MAG: T9SS type A sorting domain-containing protein [Saprospiraceae bacterium]|nr:T9SS type A sorting domain-containing protein [Saprospiraceae bacterium]
MKRSLLLFVLIFPVLLYGQQAVLSTGGNGTGTGGTSSYSVGQVAYTYKGSGPSVDEGVQQAFEVTNLPIELLYFEAKATKTNQVELSWETATEVNNDYFTIERSQDSRDWESLGKVTGSGTTTEAQSYSQADESPYKGLSYYRLKQTDYDGSFSYSEIRSVRIGYDEISIYPNPFEGYLNISSEDYPLDYKIWDYSGKLLQSGELKGGTGHLNLGDLLPGNYTLELRSERAILFTQKILKF